MQRAKIKPEYCDSPEEQNMIFVIIEDNGDRCFITPEKSDLLYPGHELVLKEHLELID